MSKKNISVLAKNKILRVATSLFFLSNFSSPACLAANGAVSGADLMTVADKEDIQTLRQLYADGYTNLFVPMNLIAKGYSLNRYETLMMSESLKNSVVKSSLDMSSKTAALDKIINIEVKYSDEYQSVFGKAPEDTQSILSKNADKTAVNDTAAPQTTQEKGQGYNVDNNQQLSNDQLNAMALENLKNYFGEEKANEILSRNTPPSGSDSSGSAPTDIPTVQNFREQALSASTPEDMADKMSLINIRKQPQYANITVGREGYEYSNAQNPIMDLNGENIDLAAIKPGDALDKSPIDQYEKDSLAGLLNTVAASAEKEAKHFFITLEHNIYYVDEKGEGNVPLDTTNLDANGLAYRPSVTRQYQLTESLGIGLGVRVHKALDLIMSMVAVNDSGVLGKDGTTWEFGNVLFKFHPERMSRAELKKMNSEGVVVEQGGRIIGKRIGHKTTVTTDTQTGTTAVTAGSAVMQYDKENGLTFTNTADKYFVALGNMSLNLSNYTLQLSDCRAVEVGYHDNNESLLLLYGKPKDGGKEGFTDDNGNKIRGTYESKLFAAQWVKKNLLKNVTLSFNFAKAKDSGELSNPNGALKGNTTVYSLAIKSTNNNNTSFEGEFAHSINNYDENSENLSRSGNADYLDITHQFSRRLKGSLHLININGTYDAGSLVEDRTGDYIMTTNTGDGEKDYLYQPGQKGLDLVLNYQFPENASLAFGYTRYSQTTTLDENSNPVSKTMFYLAGNKQWDLYNSLDKSRGTVGVQQRFEYNDTSNTDYIRHKSSTTVSYSGSPWDDGEASVNYQKIFDNAEGNQNRFDLTVAHHFYPLSRVSITPKMEYSRKTGEPGITNTQGIDSSILINSLTIGYELIPDELTTNLLISKEKYDVIQSEIDEASGKKIDGERRNVLGVGLGLVWEPKKIAGLTVGMSYRKNKVEYFSPQYDISHQDVWEYNIEYRRPLSDNIRASISYDYQTARDRAKPIYDEVTRTVEIDIDAQIGKHTTLQLSNSYEYEYKPLDASANHMTRSTVLQMKNKF